MSLNDLRRHETSTRERPWRELAFLAIFGLYLDRCVDLRLVFWNQNDLFLGNFRFARDFMVSPGLPCQWLGKLMLQPCRFGWPGAVLVALVAGVLLLAARRYLSAFAPGAAVRNTWLVPAIVLIVLQGQYGFPLSITLGLGFALCGASLYVGMPGRSPWARLGAFGAASLLLYYVVGDVYFVFASCCMIYELLPAGRRLLALSFLPVALAVKVGLDEGLSYLNATRLYFDLPETSHLIPGGQSPWLLGLLDVYFPACALLLAARLLWRVTPAAGWPKRHAPQPTADCRQGGSPGPGARELLLTGVSFLLVIAAAVAVVLFGPRDTKRILEIDLASANGDWSKVLETAPGLPPSLYAEYANHDVNLALYHLGRLPDDMFSYPQWRLFADHGFGSRGRLLARKGFDLLLEIGRVNEAETIAHNDLERHASALGLMRVALTKLVKGQRQAARVYLNVLRDDLSYGAWTQGYLERIREGAELWDLEIATPRSRRIEKDDALESWQPPPDESSRESYVSAERQFASLLEHNPRNRMAMEYLMALHLLKRDVDSVVARLPQIKEFSYPGTPATYEEAAMLYLGRRPEARAISTPSVTVSGCPISERTVSRFLHVVEIDAAHQGMESPAAAAAGLRDLGRSYFFYYFFGGDPSQ